MWVAELFNALRAALGEINLGPHLPQNSFLPPPTCCRRILLTDDNEINRHFMSSLLESCGHSVVVAQNGREAVEAFEREPFDLILMDVQMPVMDGFQATAAIREKEKTILGHVPIVAITAHAMRGDRERCLEAGMDGYISKPIDPNRFYEIVEGLQPAPPEGDQDRQNLSSTEEDKGESSEWFDVAKALEKVKGRAELLLEVAELFMEQSPVLLQEIGEAIGRSDGEALRLAAHTLKGSAGYFAVDAVFDTALRMEHMGRDADFGGAQALFEDLNRMVERLNDSLQELVKRENLR